MEKKAEYHFPELLCPGLNETVHRSAFAKDVFCKRVGNLIFTEEKTFYIPVSLV